MATNSTEKRIKHIPGGNVRGESIFDFPFLKDKETIDYINSHSKIMFIIRGPPGTAKNTLSSMLSKNYEDGVVCSADNYFERTFASKTRHRNSLKESHAYCQKRTIEECESETHPVIVKNTHMKKYEVKTYIDIANKYGYTIVMAITLRKFDVNPDVLERTNRKGLTKTYFAGRLSCWEEYIPLYLGWFLGSNDCFYLLDKTKNILVQLLGDGRFRNIFSINDDDDILHYFKPETNLSCISFYENFSETREFYLSDSVQDCYGKCYALSFQGFIISKSYILAVVTIPKNGKHLVSKKEPSNDPLLEAFANMDITTSEIPKTKGKQTSFMNKFIYENTSVVSKEWDDATLKMNINDLSIIIIASKNKKPIKNVKQLLLSIFNNIVDSDNNISIKFSELDNGLNYFRLPNDMWFVRMNEAITMNALFTGCYV